MPVLRENAACIPDAENVSEVWGCSGAQWLVQLTSEAPTLFSTQPVLLNIGANKGYSAPHFLNLWSQHPNATTKAWFDAIRDVARGKTAVSGEDGSARRHGFLATQMCGACGACHGSVTAPHSRSGGRVHLLEMTVANSLLLRHLTNATNLDGMITVHNVAASNESGTIFSPKVTMGTEYAVARNDEASSREALDRVEQVAVDAFVSRRELPWVIDVATIDTEGHDPLVLEGMSAMLKEKRITLLEFEYHSKGFWSPYHRESRTLRQVTAMLEQMGYRCYLEGPPSLYLPITQGCWRPRFERHKWSNVFCTHDAQARAIINAKAWAAFDLRAKATKRSRRSGRR